MRQLKQTGCLFFFFLLGSLCLSYGQSGVSIEAASRDITLTVRGPERVISSVNPSEEKSLDNGIVLLSSKYGQSVSSNKNRILVQVDDKMKVTKVLSGQLADMAIPQQGFVLMASGDNDKKFLSENFKEGDVLKLRINGEIKALAEVIASGGKENSFDIRFDKETIYTSLKKEELISGEVVHFNRKNGYKMIVEANGKEIQSVRIAPNGTFSFPVRLNEGVNYFDVKMTDSKKTLSTASFMIYRKKVNTAKPEIVMWVEQFPNALTLTSENAIEEMMLKCKEAGVTAFGLDVKGPEGYVSYKKNDLSQSPYFTSTINPKKKVEPSGMDLLESFVELAHKHDMKVYASFNFFTEGNVTTNDYAILKGHPGWEEIVQRPEDKGKLLKISESTAGQEARAGKRIVLGFVNPANKDVQDFQLLRVEEVLKNYAVDGVVMDRCRYDNLYADFSDVSKQKFAEYLRQEGKELERFPADAFLIDENGKMIEGKYYMEWITFRSGVIKQFTDRVRMLVDKYKKEKNPDLKLAAYVGSWFEVYWQNGVNWSSRNFRYNERLHFPENRLYTDKYYQTSYTGNIDFLMIGTYYKTAKEVSKYITLGNILTNGELPLYGSMSLPDLKTDEQAQVFAASLTNSSGLMLFDLCYVDWKTFIGNLLQAIEESNKQK